jgi:hypothetical protein
VNTLLPLLGLTTMLLLLLLLLLLLHQHSALRLSHVPLPHNFPQLSSKCNLCGFCRRLTSLAAPLTAAEGN